MAAEQATRGAAVEAALGRPLAIYSGGGTGSFVMMRRGSLPGAFNNLRLGEALLLQRAALFQRGLAGFFTIVLARLGCGTLLRWCSARGGCLLHHCTRLGDLRSRGLRLRYRHGRTYLDRDPEGPQYERGQASS